MSVLPIYNCFHPILKKKTEPVKEINQEVFDFVKNMYDTLYNISNGVGLAANQAGKSLSIFIIDLRAEDSNEKPEPITFINPEIIEFSDDEIDSKKDVSVFLIFLRM